MREIKFRAWDKLTQKYWNIENWHFEDEYLDLIEPGVSICDSHIKRIWRKQRDVELMQYVGLKDVHGVKIYEGDIVKWGDQPNGHESPIRIGVVELNPDIQFIAKAGIFIFIFEYGRFAYKETNKYLTVIGNRFENPELLEVN